MYSDNKFSIWCPLIGFDVEAEDKGVAEYLNKIGAKPYSIALFVFQPDMMYYHEGMDKEILLPKECSNYYGAERNEIRSIQPWTNYDLRDLVQRLKAEGIKVYFSYMGMHTVKKDRAGGGLFGYVAQENFLDEHQECCIEGVPWDGHTYLPKRMSGGTYFADFLADKAVKMLADYGADGIHLADALFPPCMQLQEGDMSFDMLERFEKYLGCDLPKGLAHKDESTKYIDIKERANYVWSNLREEWITFNSESWADTIKKIADKLHANNFDLMTCNAWTSEPFEALYRYGIDYSKVAKAGIDYMALEQQATTTFTVDSSQKMMTDWERYSCSMLTKAYAKETSYLSMNFVKDSTEEASTVSFFPAATEREIHQYMNWYLLGDKLQRASDGYFICLGDALKKSEWDLVIKNYERVFKEEPSEYMGVVLGWTDSQINKFLPEYLKGRRWSAHRILSRINRKGAGVCALVDLSDIDKFDKDVFIPNADLLTKEELEKVNNATCSVVLTTIRGEEHKLASLTGFEKHYDEGVNEDEFQSVVYVKSSTVSLKSVLEGIDFGARLGAEDMSKVKDTRIWCYELVFRTVSDGYLSLLAKILRSLTYKKYDISLDSNIPFTLLKMADGRYRIMISNSCLIHYDRAIVRLNGELTSLTNIVDFPMQPIKLVMENGAVVAQDTEGEQIKKAKGFCVKIAPGGVGIVDFCINK